MRLREAWFTKSIGIAPKPFLSFPLIQEIELCQQQMKLLTREGQTEQSFILDKMLKPTPTSRGGWGGGCSRECRGLRVVRIFLWISYVFPPGFFGREVEH